MLMITGDKDINNIYKLKTIIEVKKKLRIKNRLNGHQSLKRRPQS